MDKDVIIAGLASTSITSVVALIGHWLTARKGKTELDLAIRRLETEIDAKEEEALRQERDEVWAWKTEQLDELKKALEACKGEKARALAALERAEEEKAAMARELSRLRQRQGGGTRR